MPRVKILWDFCFLPSLPKPQAPREYLRALTELSLDLIKEPKPKGRRGLEGMKES